MIKENLTFAKEDKKKVTVYRVGEFLGAIVKEEVFLL